MKVKKWNPSNAAGGISATKLVIKTLWRKDEHLLWLQQKVNETASFYLIIAIG